MQVIYRSTTMLRLWSPPPHANYRDLSIETSTRLEDMARDIFFPKMDVSVIDELPSSSLAVFKFYHCREFLFIYIFIP
jgi:hypothetical protein